MKIWSKVTIKDRNKEVDIIKAKSKTDKEMLELAQKNAKQNLENAKLHQLQELQNDYNEVGLYLQEKLNLSNGAYLFIENIGDILKSDLLSEVKVIVLNAEKISSHEELISRLSNPNDIEEMTASIISCTLDSLTRDERDILREGCLINYYKSKL